MIDFCQRRAAPELFGFKYNNGNFCDRRPIITSSILNFDAPNKFSYFTMLLKYLYFGFCANV